MLKAKLSSYYRKAGGLMVFVYLVLGTVEELAKYATAQGANFRKNDAGEPLFFSTRPLSTNRAELIPLTITTTGRVVADDLTKVLSQESKLDDYILQEKAKLMARIAVGGNGVESLTNLTSSRQVATPEEVEEVIATSIETTVGENVPA